MYPLHLVACTGPGGLSTHQLEQTTDDDGLAHWALEVRGLGEKPRILGTGVQLTRR